MEDLAARAASLLALHADPEILVLANAWDVVSVQVVLRHTGRALTTAGHATASTFGSSDGENIPLELHLDMVQRTVRPLICP